MRYDLSFHVELRGEAYSSYQNYSQSLNFMLYSEKAGFKKKFGKMPNHIYSLLDNSNFHFKLLYRTPVNDLKLFQGRVTYIKDDLKKQNYKKYCNNLQMRCVNINSMRITLEQP